MLLLFNDDASAVVEAVAAVDAGNTFVTVNASTVVFVEVVDTVDTVDAGDALTAVDASTVVVVVEAVDASTVVVVEAVDTTANGAKTLNRFDAVVVVVRGPKTGFRVEETLGFKVEGTLVFELE